jgi:hypothetical protein
MLDSAALADLIAELIGEHVERATAPLLERIVQLEARGAAQMDPEALNGAVASAVAEQLPAAIATVKGDPGIGIAEARLDDGRLVLALTDGSERDLGSVIGEPGKDGRDGDAGEPGKDGRDGTDALGLVEAQIDGEGQLVLTLTDGSVKSLGIITGKDGRDGDAGEPGKDGRDGTDGLGLAGALIDHEGQLVLTMTDGSVKSLGIIMGKDGRDGDAGEPGKDGRDGFSLDDFDVAPAGDGRTVVLSFTRGEITEQFEVKFPVPIYRGVWREKDEAGNKLEYSPGDLVTWGGSLWHCDEKTGEKPDAGSWRLAVKKGRDGKDLAK